VGKEKTRVGIDMSDSELKEGFENTFAVGISLGLAIAVILAMFAIYNVIHEMFTNSGTYGTFARNMTRNRMG